jgi:DNA-binding GntR family transcriptional regulator
MGSLVGEPVVLHGETPSLGLPPRLRQPRYIMAQRRAPGEDIVTAAADSPVRRVEARSVVEQVTAEIRRAIISGSLEPGQEFSLREMAGLLGVSFIPVREALRSLETEGLVVTRPGRSAVVAPVHLEDLHGIYRLRHILEPEIASRSCLRLDPKLLDDLEREAVAFGREDLGVDEVYEAHQAFHLALLAPAATEWDLRILTTLWRAAERYIRIGFRKLDPEPEEHHRREHAHEELLDAFRSRDPRRVADAVGEHLERNEALARAAFDHA